MASRRSDLIFVWLVVATLLLLSISGTIARKEGKPAREDEKLRDSVRGVYKKALYDFQACTDHDTHDVCCPVTMKSITSGTGLKQCELYERFLFTRGLTFLCDKPTIEQKCPKLLVKQPKRTMEA